MGKTYTYDPAKMCDGGKDQLRFDLGDTATDGGAETCVLCDEEYEAILKHAEGAGRGIKYAKYRCLEAIVMKLAYEVDFSADGLSMSLSQRYERWRKMYEEAKKQFQTIKASAVALGDGAPDGGHYFRAGMHDNVWISCPSGPFRHDM